MRLLPGSHPRRAALAACALSAAAALAAPAGCGDEEVTETPVGPAGELHVTIVSPQEGACVSVGSAPDALVPIQLDVGGMYLRPKGACGELAPPCGHLELRVSGVPNSESASSVIDLRLQKLADRYATLALTVAAVYDDGEPILGSKDGQPIAAQRTIVTAVSCEADAGAGGGGGSGGGGTGGAAGGGGSGGAGGEAGSGGAGGSGGGQGGAGGQAGGGGEAGAGGQAGGGGATGGGEDGGAPIQDAGGDGGAPIQDAGGDA